MHKRRGKLSRLHIHKAAKLETEVDSTLIKDRMQVWLNLIICRRWTSKMSLGTLLGVAVITQWILLLGRLLRCKVIQILRWDRAVVHNSRFRIVKEAGMAREGPVARCPHQAKAKELIKANLQPSLILIRELQHSLIQGIYILGANLWTPMGDRILAVLSDQSQCITNKTPT